MAILSQTVFIMANYSLSSLTISCCYYIILDMINKTHKTGREKMTNFKMIKTDVETQITEKKAREIMGDEEFEFQLKESENGHISWQEDDIEIFF